MPQGGGNSFTVTGTEAPANSEQWDIINSASTVVATASLPSGWTVSLTGTQFSVAAPTNASVATNYRVRYGSGGVTPGPLSVRKAFFRSQLQSNSYNEWGQYVPPQSIASRRRLAGGGANPPIGGGGGGTTGQSAIFDVVSGGTPPAAPSSLIATPISSSRIDLAWTDNAHNESGFTIQRQLTVGGTWAEIGTVGANVNSYSSFGLSPDTSYRFRVKATNSWGASAWSNEAIASTFPSAPLPPSYLGNDFWAVLPAGGPDQGQSVWLHIAAPDGATGMIAIPSSNTQIPFTVSAGDAVRIQLPMGQPYPQGAGLRLYTSEGIESKSIRITSDNAITVQVQSSIYAASESFALQPTSVLGKSYVVASYPSSGGIMAGMFAIQATQAATTVTVRTTKTVGTLFQAGVPYTFVLQAGEAFQLRDTSGQDLTGSLITSDKPVAVYSGSNGANVPIGIVAANPLTEQLVPVERWGYTYYSAGFATKTADSVYRVLAYKNNTPIAIDGVVVATIQKGEFYEFSSPNGVQISSTKPIQPFEYCAGGSADFVTNSDPSMTAIPAVTSYASTYLFYAANDPSFYTGLFVNLYVPTSALSSMRLNGVAIPLSNFTSIGSTSYSVAKLAVPAGKNLITSTTGAKFGAINYGFGSYDSFSSPLGGDLPENFVTNVTPLPASSLSATTISSSQINLAWTDNASNEDGFRIERKLTTPGSEWSEIASVSANTTTYQNTGLTKLTTYIYRVKAYADFDSTPSNEAQATTLDAPPAIPTNLACQVLSQTEIKLTWNDVSDNEQGFKIQRKQGTGAWTDVQTLGSGITTWTDTGLTKKTTYSYRVFAYNAVGNSDYSNVSTATTKDSIPNPPTNLAATAPSWNLVTLSWTDASDNEDGFKLERRQGAGAWVQISSPVPNTTSYIDSTVQASTTYSYRVRGYNTGGDSGWSNESTITTPAAPIPSAPTNLSAIATSASTISLNWTDTSTTETGFTVQRAPLGSSSWSTVGTANQNVTVCSDTGLSANTGYSYRVCAFNATGSSAWSNVASTTTQANSAVVGPAGPPAICFAVASGSTSINIYWTPSDSAIAYKVYRGETLGGPKNLISNSGIQYGNQRIQTLVDSSLVTGSIYYYFVTAVTSTGESSPSPECSDYPESGAMPLNSGPFAILQWAVGQQVAGIDIVPIGMSQTTVIMPDGSTIDGQTMSVQYSPENVRLTPIPIGPNPYPPVPIDGSEAGCQISAISQSGARYVEAEVDPSTVSYSMPSSFPNLTFDSSRDTIINGYEPKTNPPRYEPGPLAGYTKEATNQYVGFSSWKNSVPSTWLTRRTRRNTNSEFGFNLNHYGSFGVAALRFTPFFRLSGAQDSQLQRNEINFGSIVEAQYIRADIAAGGVPGLHTMRLRSNVVLKAANGKPRYVSGEARAILGGVNHYFIGVPPDDGLGSLNTQIRAKFGLGLDQGYSTSSMPGGSGWVPESNPNLYFKLGHYSSGSKAMMLMPGDNLRYSIDDPEPPSGGNWDIHKTDLATWTKTGGIYFAGLRN